MDQEKIGKFIASIRKEKNMTQEQLAEILGVNVKSISRWENAKTMPDLAMFPLLAEVLDVEVSELLNGQRMTKDELIKLKDTIDKLIEYTSDKQAKDSRSLNKYLKWGAFLIILALLDNSFSYLNLIFTPDIADFVSGLLYGGGLSLELIGIYNNSHAISIQEKKKQLIKKLKTK